MTSALPTTNRFFNEGKNTPLIPEDQKLFLAPTNTQDSYVIGADNPAERRLNSYMECNLLEVNEVCSLLKIGRSTLYGLVNRKEIKAVKLLGRTLFRQKDLAAFVASLNSYEGVPNGF